MLHLIFCAGFFFCKITRFDLLRKTAGRSFRRCEMSNDVFHQTNLGKQTVASENHLQNVRQTVREVLELLKKPWLAEIYSCRGLVWLGDASGRSKKKIRNRLNLTGPFGWAQSVGQGPLD